MLGLGGGQHVNGFQGVQMTRHFLHSHSSIYPHGQLLFAECGFLPSVLFTFVLQGSCTYGAIMLHYSGQCAAVDAPSTA